VEEDKMIAEKKDKIIISYMSVKCR